MLALKFRMHKLIFASVLYAFFLHISSNAISSSDVIFCYWGTWSHYRLGDGKFEANNIDPSLCTHIGYAFFGLEDNYQITSLRPKLDFDLENIAKTIGLKEKNPNLNIMASIGGWNHGSEKFSAMASTIATRSVFINSTLKFLLQNKFDGLDVDWEYPAQRGGSPADRNNFVSLLKELNAVLKTRNLLLTIAVAAGKASANISYDIPNVAEHVDLINLMSYSFSSLGQNKTGLKAPLQGNGEKNVKAAFNFWLQNGAPANKLVMGLAFSGRSFTLANKTQNWIGAPADGNGRAGPIMKKSGILGYNEICLNLRRSDWKRRFNDTYLMAYAFNDTQWVGYDDSESLKYKIEFMKSLKLAGVMIWSIEADDFRGNCGSYSLLKTIKNLMEQLP